MVNVTKSNFVEQVLARSVVSPSTRQQSNDLLQHLPTAAFVAIDEEMTGIMLPGSNRPPQDDTPSQRYQAKKAVPERYSMVQLSPSELLLGPLQLSILMVYLGLFHFLQPEAALLLAAVGIGDGLAPLIGKWYGRHVYTMPFAKPKSMEGSVCGVFLGTIAGCYLYPYLLDMDWFPLRIVLAYGGIAAVVEGTAPAHVDNILVPLVLYFSMDKVDRWMPA